MKTPAESTKPWDYYKVLATVPGAVPSPAEMPQGCRFSTRCPFAVDKCRTEEPPLADLSPGHAVACPWIARAPAALECRLHSFLEIGNSREIVLGEVLHAHLRADAVDERLHIDPAIIDAVGRMGGHGYAGTRQRFDLPTMSTSDHIAGQMPNRRDG